MTTEQLDHLRRIDATLERKLAKSEYIPQDSSLAEAGWKATRAAIVAIRLTVPPHCPQSLLRKNDEVRTAYNLMTDILAAFPLELVKP